MIIQYGVVKTIEMESSRNYYHQFLFNYFLHIIRDE